MFAAGWKLDGFRPATGVAGVKMAVQQGIHRFQGPRVSGSSILGAVPRAVHIILLSILWSVL